MNTPSDQLQKIQFITLPASAAQTIGDFHLDPTIPIPVQLPQKEKTLDPQSVTIELIVAGMLKILAWEPNHQHASYYRSFVLASQPDAAQELNIAAIAQEQKGDMLFAEELFRAVCALAPQSASYINLATLYSRIAAADTQKAEVYDAYQQRALDTLRSGLDAFAEDPDLLREIGFFHLYQGSVELARTYLQQYLDSEGEEDERKAHTRKIMTDIQAKIADDQQLMAAYDAIQMNNETQAITTLDAFLESHPTVWNAWFLKGWALRRMQQFGEAQQAFIKALSYAESGSSDLYNELAICALESGDRPLAKEYLNTAVDLDEENVTLLSNLAYLHLADDELSEAREYLERARALEPEDPVVEKLIDDYQAQSGDTIGPPIVQEYLSSEEVIEHMKDHQEV
ncbi:MAG TPA: tetratricopeptide repeat protein [Sphaerochaeta sp.]|nr:tetratricopeptide repeat protein [Sphaerochaeta sp.]